MRLKEDEKYCDIYANQIRMQLLWILSCARSKSYSGWRAVNLSHIRLGKISFVPVQMPIAMESGGCVIYRRQVCRFDQVLSGNKGCLGFTVMPTLDEDISPPQVKAWHQ